MCTCRQVSGDSVEEYKQNVRDGLRRLLDPPVDPLGGPVEWIIVYVRPSTIDALSKGPSKASHFLAGLAVHKWTPFMVRL